MALDWLFGKPVVEVNPGYLQLRSLVIDQDTVRDVLALVRGQTSDAAMYYLGPQELSTGIPTAFDMSRLETAADWEVRRLKILGGGNTFSVELCRGMQPHVTFGDPQHAELAQQVASLMLAEGTPRPLWKPFIPRMPVLAAVVAVACWIWFLLDQRPPVSFGITGSIVVSFTTLVAWEVRVRLHRRMRYGFPGHRIRTMSRQEVRRQRADRHANLKVAAITLPAGALLAAAAIWLFGAY